MRAALSNCRATSTFWPPRSRPPMRNASITQAPPKIFGGACVMEAFRIGGRDLGGQNVEVARQLLSAARIAVVAEDVGGNHGRKLIFRTDTGEAIVKRVTS